MVRVAGSVLLVAVIAGVGGAATSIRDGKDLVRAMHDRYAGTWYHTLTFVQKTTNYEADGTEKVETWYEALACPGRLRIDFDPVSNGNGILFADDTVYRVEKGALVESRPLVHPLMVLGFDVYCDAPETTVARLEKLGVDLGTVREDTWNGTPVYVVGAKAGDDTTVQFWIEKERLVFLRMLRPAGPDKSKKSEVVFDRYVKAGGGWVAAEVRFSVDGKLATKEAYSDIRTGDALPDALFDPKRWSETRAPAAPRT
jgi:hypothetical protein